MGNVRRGQAWLREQLRKQAGDGDIYRWADGLRGVEGSGSGRSVAIANAQLVFVFVVSFCSLFLVESRVLRDTHRHR